jgi:polar amino acid transport system substrate-binding protein
MDLDTQSLKSQIARLPFVSHSPSSVLHPASCVLRPASRILPPASFILRRVSLVIGHWSFVIFHLSFVICLAACTRPDDAWDRVRESGVMRVGMDASFPPFETIAADGALVGFDVDLARELGQRLGIKVQFIANLPYDGLYDALAVDRVDVVISALVVNPTQMADFAYSTPYFDAGEVLVVHAGETGIGGMPDLGGRTLAVEFGTQGDLEARKWARRLAGVIVVHYQTAAEALAAVEIGEADAVLVDHVSALAAGARAPARKRPMPDAPQESGDGKTLIIVGTPAVEEPYAVAARRESRHLLQAIDDALAEMEADGTMEALRVEWLGGG